jgi:hypothetical protein
VPLGSIEKRKKAAIRRRAVVGRKYLRLRDLAFLLFGVTRGREIAFLNFSSSFFDSLLTEIAWPDITGQSMQTNHCG